MRGSVSGLPTCRSTIIPIFIEALQKGNRPNQQASRLPLELRKVEYPHTVKTAEPVKIVSTWVNVGVAWCCRGASLTWNLVNEKSTVCWSVTDPAFDLKRLDPTLGGEEKPVTVEIDVPSSASRRRIPIQTTVSPGPAKRDAIRANTS